LRKRTASADLDAIRSYEYGTPEERARISPAEIEAALHRSVEQNSRNLLIHLRTQPCALAALPAEGVAEVWRTLARGERGTTAIEALERLPEPVRALISVEEILAAWVATAQSSGFGAIRLLPLLPEPVRAAIDPERVREAWRDALQSAPGHAAEQVSRLPTDVRALLGADAEAQAHFADGRERQAKALDERLARGFHGTARLHEAPIGTLWRGFASRHPGDALEWFRKQRAIVRAQVPVESVHEAWRRLLDTRPRRALEWWGRMPKRLRPALGEAEQFALLQSESAEVRLWAIAHGAELRAAARPQPSPAARRLAR
jgi:hypothetical protein